MDNRNPAGPASTNLHAIGQIKDTTYQIRQTQLAVTLLLYRWVHDAYRLADVQSLPKSGQKAAMQQAPDAATFSNLQSQCMLL